MIEPKERWTLFGCIVVVLATLFACKKKPPTQINLTANPRTAVGRYYTLTVDSAKTCEVKEEYLQPKKGNILLGVDMIVEAIGDERVGVWDHEMKLVDLKGQEYKSSLARCAPALDFGRYLEKHQTLRGILTFEVPETTSGVTLVFSNVISPAIGMDETRVQLSR